MKTYQPVLDFWFHPEHAPYWFENSTAFDEKIRSEFYDPGTLFLELNVGIGVNLFRAV